MLTRLLVLWLLSEQSLHGYRIKKILDDEALRFWFPVEYASIYAVLRSLVRGGFVESVAVEREGQRPERTRYAITREGRRHLSELLERAWRELPAVGDPLALALTARSDLEDESRVPGLLGARCDALRERLARLEALARSAPAPEMVDRQRALAQAELEWAETLLTKEGGGTNG